MTKKFLDLAAACAACGAAMADTSRTAGAWSVDFAPAEARLTLSHAASGARIAGRLSFTGPAKVTGAGVAVDPSQTAAWRVADARDGAKGRLALVDPADNVHGYIAFQPDGDRVSLLVYHRTAFAYEGELRFEADVTARGDAIPCRLAPKAHDRVLSVKSGAAVSSDDDALFSPARRATRCRSPSCATTTGAAGCRTTVRSTGRAPRTRRPGG